MLEFGAVGQWSHGIVPKSGKSGLRLFFVTGVPSSKWAGDAPLAPGIYRGLNG